MALQVSFSPRQFLLRSTSTFSASLFWLDFLRRHEFFGTTFSWHDFFRHNFFWHVCLTVWCPELNNSFIYFSSVSILCAARIIQFFVASPDKRASLTKNALKSRPLLIHNGKQTCEWRWQNDSAQVIREEVENNMRYNRISVSQSLDEIAFNDVITSTTRIHLQCRNILGLHCHAMKNKNANHSIQNVLNLRNERR